MPKTKSQKVKLPTGEMLELFYLNRLSKEINRTSQTIRMWETEHIIPQTMFHDKAGCRLYSMDMIKVVKRAIEISDLKRGKNIASTPFSSIVYKEWGRLKNKYLGKEPTGNIIEYNKRRKEMKNNA